MIFDWVNYSEVEESVIRDFESGVTQYDDFIHSMARHWSSEGESVTYVCVDSDEVKERAFTRIYAFAAINAAGLLYEENGKKSLLSCAEIRLFAISKVLRKRHDPTITWSDDIFKSLLQMLYEMSTKTIGFRGIFLNANNFGYNLYKRNGFSEISDYIVPEDDDKLDIENCTPLLLVISSDTLYDIFL